MLQQQSVHTTPIQTQPEQPTKLSLEELERFYKANQNAVRFKQEEAQLDEIINQNNKDAEVLFDGSEKVVGIVMIRMIISSRAARGAIKKHFVVVDFG
jgi:cellobiose-specific phosphotransferase system component IIC